MAIALRNAGRRGFKHSFSAYISWLIERDEAGSVVREDVGKYSSGVAPGRFKAKRSAA